jgi:hypothetical protein
MGMDLVNRWKIEANPFSKNPFSRNPFMPARTPLAQKAKGGLNWGDMFDQWGHDTGTKDLIDQLLDSQHLYSPFRAFLRDEPTMRQQFGPPLINNYGQGHLPGSNVPAEWQIRKRIPWWGDEPETPRPGGAPTQAYAWIG